MRERAGRPAAEIARTLGWSESKLSRIETANSSINNEDLRRLLDVYNAPEAERKRLLALATQSRQRAWWEAYGDSLLGPYETLIGFEAEAATVFTYDAVILHGLLQTVEYAGAIVQTLSAGERPDIVGERVSVRMARQSVLTRDPPPQLWSIIDEAVLRRPIGGRDVMRRQLMRLLEVGDRPTVTLQVLPLSVGAHRGVDGSFSILEFPEGSNDQPLVYCDGMTGGVFRNRPDEIRRYHMSFESLRSISLGHAESLEVIQNMIHSPE
jgi:transcriptional regulator with XRE-family HTH domain